MVKDKFNWVLVQQTGQLWKSGNKYPQLHVAQLMKDLKRYKIQNYPFDSMPINGDLATLKLYQVYCIQKSSSRVAKVGFAPVEHQATCSRPRENILSHELVPLCKAQSAPVQRS